MIAQLAMSVPAPGYYSVEASTSSSGTGHVAWFPDEATALDAARASFARAHRLYRPPPTPTKVTASLLVAGPDRGAWRDLPSDIRTRHADWPWFPDRKTTT